jgi:insecticidal toxin complex protein TccC
MGVHSHTPKVSVFDPRGLSLRTVDYWRAAADAPAATRINRTLRDASGRARQQWDPRLWAQQALDPLTPANLSQVFTLGAQLIRSDSVDGGTRLELVGPDAQPATVWDSRGTCRAFTYDALRRPLAIDETAAGEPRRCVERMTYGHPGAGDAGSNQFARLIRHDHPAGSVLYPRFALGGRCTEDTRHFTREPTTPDWPEAVEARQALLEPGAGATSRWLVGALGDVLAQTDASGNRHRFRLTCDGRLREQHLQLTGQPGEQALVSAIAYNAQGNIERETAGNGVQTCLVYRPEDGRLSRRRAVDAGGRVLQQLLYQYDAMGNVLSIEDQALPVRHFANQRIDPVSRFSYDSLYQLREATGWEAGSLGKGPHGHVDAAALSNYRQHYEYDAGGNLVRLIHFGAQRHGRTLQVARYSNRAVPYDTTPPDEAQIAAAFDGNGNMLALDAGRRLQWNPRNQLQSLSPVERASADNDDEVYLYDASGQRVRKIRSLHTGTRRVVAEVRYLPGLELRSDSGSGERLQVVNVEGGLNRIRLLHWDSPPPSGGNDQLRYSLCDDLRSVCLELADDGRLLTRENYYPFGETAYQTAADGAELNDKTLRYSGKERDASGLCDFGLRYYIPWLQRWASADPAGFVDGPNLYAMVGNNPLTFRDALGLEKTGKYEIEVGLKNRLKFLAATLASRIAVFREATGKFKEVNDFEVVEVGGFSDYLVGGDELKQALRHYRQRYKQLAREESAPRVAGQPSNFALGANIAGYMLRSANDKFFDDSSIDPENRHPDFVVERRFFAVMNKADKFMLPEQRQIYGLSELNTFTEKGKTEVDVVQVVVHPQTQPGGRQAHTDGEPLPLLRGVGTFLTVHSVKAVAKGTQVHRIRTDAVNPRSARIARKFDARLVANR